MQYRVEVATARLLARIWYTPISNLAVSMTRWMLLTVSNLAIGNDVEVDAVLQRWQPM